MKDVAGMLAEKYGATADEIVAAGAMKLYLQSMEPAEALRKARAVYEPKVIRLDSVAKACRYKAILMVQSTLRSSMSPWRLRIRR